MTRTWQTLGLGGFVLAATLAFTSGTSLAIEQSEQGKREMHEQMRNEMRQLEDKHEQDRRALQDKCKQDVRAMEDRHHSEKEVLRQKYVGSKLILLGETLLFEAAVLFLYAGFLLVCAHLFIVYYEEPTLRRLFGASYESYCKSVSRWIPRLP